ncbi:hypothetical protein GCK32_005002 [Trichostrongylus colubriformis]|uniref:Uncharacterized protein n=1 Tax=Trichostrongylus colubriformis TaxID=6319 RepID=A0AAN8F071_TRICO
MERLIFALVIIEATQVTGRGYETAKITLVTSRPYNPCNVKEYMDFYHNATVSMEENSICIGDFKGLYPANSGGKFAMKWTIDNANCDQVRKWLEMSSTDWFYKSHKVVCAPSARAAPPALKGPAASRGKADETAKIIFVTRIPYSPHMAELWMEKFPDTHIEEQSNRLGDFKDLNSANIGGRFAYTFTIDNADCDKVREWLKMSKYDWFYKSHTLVCAPSARAAPPALKAPTASRGKADETAKITLVTSLTYDPNKVNEHMHYYHAAKIQEYSKRLGDFKGMNSANIGGKFTITFTIDNADCDKVSEWLEAIVANARPYYQGQTVECARKAPPATPAPTAPPATPARTAPPATPTPAAPPSTRPKATRRPGRAKTHRFLPQLIYN